MDIIELIAIIVLIAAIVFLIYYYIQTANDGNVDFKEILNFSPKKEQTNESMLMDDEVAEKVSKSRTAITNSMRLLKLDQRVQQMLIDEMSSEGHGRALLPISDPEEQFNLAMKVFDEKLSVRETEKMIKKLQEERMLL